jgi:hypothetical protein
MFKRVFVLAAAATVLSFSAQAQQQPHNPAVRDACAADIKAHCADAKPGMPTMQCVMQNRDKMSDGCKQAMAANRGQGMGQGMGGGNAAMGGKDAKKPNP